MQNTNAGSLSSLQIKVSPLELADDISPYYFHRFMFANMHQNENCFAKINKAENMWFNFKLDVFLSHFKF